MEHEDNPTLKIRDQEMKKLVNINLKTNLQQKMVQYNKPEVMRNKSQPSLQSNGYLSKTLKSVLVGQKTQGEWIGEDLLEYMMTPEAKHLKFPGFDYSAVALTTISSYCIGFHDLDKLPFRLREKMLHFSDLRQQHLMKRVSNQYSNLQNIKKTVFS